MWRRAVSPDAELGRRPGGSGLRDRLVEIRRAFDCSFAEPPRPAASGFEDLLGIRVADAAYALRVSAVAGLFVDRTVTPLPGPVPELLGLASFRGSVVAVYHLGALLGHPLTGVPRWLVLDAGTPAVGLAFDHLDGHLRVPARCVARAADEGGHIAETVATADGLRPVVDVPAVRTAIEVRARQAGHSGRR
jgi:purine-binding chemotaxis protein CheW